MWTDLLYKQTKGIQLRESSVDQKVDENGCQPFLLPSWEADAEITEENWESEVQWGIWQVSGRRWQDVTNWSSRCPSLLRSSCNNTPLRFLLIYNLQIFLSQKSLKMKRFIGGNRIFYKFREFSFCVQIYFDKFLLRLENCNFRAFRSVFRQNWRKLTPAEIHFYPRKQVWCIPVAQLRPLILI